MLCPAPQPGSALRPRSSACARAAPSCPPPGACTRRPPRRRWRRRLQRRANRQRATRTRLTQSCARRVRRATRGGGGGLPCWRGGWRAAGTGAFGPLWTAAAETAVDGEGWRWARRGAPGGMLALRLYRGRPPAPSTQGCCEHHLALSRASIHASAPASAPGSAPRAAHPPKHWLTPMCLPLPACRLERRGLAVQPGRHPPAARRRAAPAASRAG